MLQAKETWSMSDEEKVEAARARKEKGNVRFKAGKWAAALEKYKVCIQSRLSHRPIVPHQQTVEQGSMRFKPASGRPRWRSTR